MPWTIINDAPLQAGFNTNATSFHPDLSVYATSDGEGVTLFETAGEDEEWTEHPESPLRAAHQEENLYDLDFSVYGDYLAWCDDDALYVFETETWTEIDASPLDTGVLYRGVAWTHEYLFGCNQAAEVRVWDITDGWTEAPESPLTVDTTANLRDVEASPDYVAFGGDDVIEEIYVYDSATLTELSASPLAAPASQVQRIDFHPDGIHMAVGFWDDEVRVWDITDGWAEHPNSPHSRDEPGADNTVMTSNRYHPSGDYLIVTEAGEDHDEHETAILDVPDYDPSGHSPLDEWIREPESLAINRTGTYFGGGDWSGENWVWTAPESLFAPEPPTNLDTTQEE